MGNIKGIICVKVNNKTIYINDKYENDKHSLNDTDKSLHKSSVDKEN